MELLGTTGNTPGPTAAKAQIVYDAMQKEAIALANAKKKRKLNYHDVGVFKTSEKHYIRAHKSRDCPACFCKKISLAKRVYQ